jgi:hypothetical protein
MDLKIAEALRTCKVLPLREHLAHMALGLVCEYDEFMVSSGGENEKEELGDMLWYLRCACVDVQSGDMLFDITKEEIDKYRGEEEFDHFHSIVKKIFAYTDEADISKHLPDYRTAYFKALAEVIAIIEGYDYSIEEVVEYNITKLKARYPEKFSNQDALERKDKWQAL